MIVQLAPPDGPALGSTGHRPANDTRGRAADLVEADARLWKRLEQFPATAARTRAAKPELLDFACALLEVTCDWLRHFPAELAPGSERDILLRAYCATARGRYGAAADMFTCPGVPASVTFRWIAKLLAAGMLERIVDAHNPGQFCVRLSDPALAKMERWLSDVRRRVRQAV